MAWYHFLHFHSLITLKFKKYISVLKKFKICYKVAPDQIRKMSLSLVKLEMRVAHYIGKIDNNHCVQTMNDEIFPISSAMLQKESVALGSSVLVEVYVNDDGIQRCLSVYPLFNDTYRQLSAPMVENLDFTIPKLEDKMNYRRYREFTTSIPTLSKDDSHLVQQCRKCLKVLENLNSDDTNKNTEKQTLPSPPLNNFDELLQRNSKTLQQNPKMIVDSENSEIGVSIKTGRILYKLFLATELYKLRLQKEMSSESEQFV